MLSRLVWLVGRQKTESLYECRRCGSTFETDQNVCSNCQGESIAHYDPHEQLVDRELRTQQAILID